MHDFVTPESVRLTLADGAFIDIKKRLNHGETEDMFQEWLTRGQAHVRTVKVLTYLLGWSLTMRGTPVPMTPDLPQTERLDTLRNLDPERFTEIHAAIEAHERAMDAERADEKKTRRGSSALASTSLSLVGADGAMSGSAN